MTSDHNDPYGPPLADPDQDRQRRWLPHPQAVRHAQALLNAEPRADLALIPMYLPGKTEGFWASGQPVHTVAGVVLLSQNTFRPTGFVPGHSWARDMAARIAALELHAWAAAHPTVGNRTGQIGTVGWATVHRDGFVAVSEDCLSPTDLLQPPPPAADDSSR